MATLTAGPLGVSRRRSAVEASPLRHIDVVLLVVTVLAQRARPVDDLFLDPRPPRPGRYRLDVLRRAPSAGDRHRFDRDGRDDRRRLPPPPRSLGARISRDAAAARSRAGGGGIPQGCASVVRHRPHAVPAERDRQGRGDHRGRRLLPPAPGRPRRVAVDRRRR